MTHRSSSNRLSIQIEKFRARPKTSVITKRMSSYEDFRPFWEAWKRNTNRPADSAEAANWDAAVEIFKALAEGRFDGGTPEALHFVRTSLPKWLERLKERDIWNPETRRLRLFRGMRNKSATHARAIGNTMLPAGRPISFSFDRSSALGFAGQGFHEGYVCSIEVPLETVVFADLDGLYREGNAHLEAEVVVVGREPILAFCEIERVPPRVKLISSRAQKTAVNAKRRDLEELELELMKKRPVSGSGQDANGYTLSERESE